MRLIENNTKKPLQWNVCVLHRKELSLRHLVNDIVSKTSGLASFTGLIGNRLSDCDKLPVVEFEQILGEELAVTTSDFSMDQKSMLKIYTALTSGHCPNDVASLNPG